MDRPPSDRRRSVQFVPAKDALEDRRLLSAGNWPPYLSKAQLVALLHAPLSNPAVRPNTPVMPYGSPSKAATFIDPSVRINNGYAVFVSSPGFIGPYATLNAHGGAIKIGQSAVILDNANIVGNPIHAGTRPVPMVLIGDHVLVGYGATILGPSTVGSFDPNAMPTEIGTGALIVGATIQPGAIVSEMARVGPGVTVPAGMRVLPGVNVTTNAEASDPALGKVVAVTSSDTANLNRMLTNNLSLAQGYNTLYQGQSSTGASPGVPSHVTGIFNGDLVYVEGTGPQPGSPTASTAFLPPGTLPKFPSPSQQLVQANFYAFRARVTGATTFHSRARNVAHSLGRGNSIRADVGQAITIGSIASTGNDVTINAPNGSQLSIGQNFTVGSNAVILGGSTSKAVLGDNVSVGAGAVVSATSLGTGTIVGSRALLLNSSFPAGTIIPAGAIYINNQLVGSVQW
jgi:carbonic anhydrase/acetyltransferase-like protein (isoleucine patch superfamily)